VTMRLRGGVLSTGLRWSKEQDDIARGTNRQVRFLSIMYYAIAVSSCLGLIAISVRTSYHQLSGTSNLTASGADTMVSGLLRAVPWLRSLVAGLTPRRPGFALGSIHVEFVVDKVALGQVFLRVLRFSSVNIIPPSLSKLISSGECVIC
jgi:hypothetical protein